MVETADVLEKFGDVINNAPRAKLVVSTLSQTSRRAVKNMAAVHEKIDFIELAKELPTLHFDDSSGSISITDSKGALMASDTVHLAPIGSGTFGEIFQSTSGTRIYKKIETAAEYEDFTKNSFSNHNYRKNVLKGAHYSFLDDLNSDIREIYSEVFAHTVLSVQNPDDVPGIYRLCKSPEFIVRRPIRESKHAAAYERPSRNNEVFWVEMDYLPYTFDYVVKLVKSTDELDGLVDGVRDGLLALDASCKFRHGDLHRGNLMISAASGINFIDFGFSCFHFINPITKKSELFTSKGAYDETVCESYDMLLLLANLIESGPLKPSLKNHLKTKLDVAPFDVGGVSYTNIYDCLTALKGDSKRIFHQAYINKLKKSDRTNLLAAVRGCPAVNIYPIASSGGASSTRRARRRRAVTRRQSKK